MIVERISASGLSRIEWRFYVTVRVHAVRVVLDEYVEQSRENRRRRWKSVVQYYRLRARASNVDKDDVSLPDDVIKEVRDRLAESITVTKDFS